MLFVKRQEGRLTLKTSLQQNPKIIERLVFVLLLKKNKQKFAYKVRLNLTRAILYQMSQTLVDNTAENCTGRQLKHNILYQYGIVLFCTAREVK